MQPMCVMRTQQTTAANATMLQTKSSSAASSFNNLVVSWMAFAKLHIYEQSKHTCLEIVSRAYRLQRLPTPGSSKRSSKSRCSSPAPAQRRPSTTWLRIVSCRPGNEKNDGVSCVKQQFKNRKKDCWHHSVKRQKTVRNARTNFPEHVPHGELVPHRDQPKKWR